MGIFLIIFIGSLWILALMCIEVLIDSWRNKDTKDVWMSIIGFISCGLALFLMATAEWEQSYSAKDYTLSIKTTTIDNQTDTTYIITRKGYESR